MSKLEGKEKMNTELLLDIDKAEVSLDAVTTGEDTVIPSFVHSADAREWAVLWLDTFKKYPDIATDKDTMIGWFANAIMAGYDYARNKERKND